MTRLLLPTLRLPFFAGLEGAGTNHYRAHNVGWMIILAVVAIVLPERLLAQPGPRQMAKVDLDKAVALYGAGNMDSALVIVDRALAKDPQLGAALKLRGDIKQKQKKIDAALADYDQAVDLGASDPRLFVSRAAAYITKGNLKAAIRDLDHAVEYAPQDADIYYNRACAIYLSGDNKGALKDVGRALKLKPDYAEALYLSGVVKGEEYREQEGMAEIEAALAKKPDLPGGYMSLAILLYESKNYEAAIEKFTEVIDRGMDGRAEAYYYRGDCHYERGDKVNACADWAISASLGEKDAIFIKKNYCETDADKIPKKPVRGRRKTVIQF